MLWIALTHTQPGPPAPPDSACWWALAYTPRVCRLDGALLLEVQASLRLFGGQAALLNQLATEAAIWGWKGLGTASTGHAALVLARHPGPTPDNAPVECLPTTRHHAPTLHRLGCHTLGQLRRLPRAGLARRFGTTVLQTLDQLEGRTPENWDWLQTPAVFEAHQTWPWRLEGVEALSSSLDHHWSALRSWLVGRHLGVTQLRMAWTYDTRRRWVAEPTPLVVRTTQATQDTDHLQHLLRERLNHIQLDAPVVRTGLVVDTTETVTTSTRPLLASQPGGQGWDRHGLLERLVARLGPDRVRLGHWQADPRPEHTHPWRPCTAAEPPAGACHNPDHWPADWAAQPPWLIDPPWPLTTQNNRPVYQGPLTLLSDAQRIETGWWHTEATQRDYFVARSPQAGLLWVYRDNAVKPGRWYLHGVYG